MYQPVLCNATVVWSDNFDDGDHEGWTIESGDFAVGDGMLKPVLGDTDDYFK